MTPLDFLRENGIRVACTQQAPEGFPVVMMSADVAIMSMKGPCIAHVYMPGETHPNITPYPTISAREMIRQLAIRFGLDPSEAPIDPEDARTLKEFDAA